MTGQESCHIFLRLSNKTVKIKGKVNIIRITTDNISHINYLIN